VPLWARLVTALAALRVVAAGVLYLSGGDGRGIAAPLPLSAYALLAASFGLVGLVLVAVNKNDVRATWLGGVFLLVAAPLCAPILRDRAGEALAWLLFVRADAFQPAFLWSFAREFPSPLIGRPARLTRAAAMVAFTAGLALALVNVSFLFWPPDPGADWRTLVRPGAFAGSLYYPIVQGLCASAFAMLIWRARQARDDEQRRMKVFALGLVAGSAPLIAQVTLEAIPAYYAFIHQPGIEQPVGLFVFGALATVPFATAYSVLFDRIVDMRVVLRAAIQYALARYTILAVTMMPFAALALLLFRQRDEPLGAIVTEVRSLLLSAVGVLGFAALRLRHTWLRALDHQFFRESYDTRQILDRVMSDALAAPTAADLEARLRQAIGTAFHAKAALLVVDEGRRELLRPDGSEPIRMDSILVSLAAAESTPMDVDPSDMRSPFRRLPTEEQQWLLAGGYFVLIALRVSDRHLVGLLALSSKRSGLPYSMDDRRVLNAVAASMSLAVDNLRLRSATDPPPEPAARECQRCARLSRHDAIACECGGQLAVGAVPETLRGVYRLDRRIGAGGMGVVYHARDMNLDRSVAIKTLPALSSDHAARLRVEARAMAAVGHPNLAVIHGIETWQGIPFLVEEYLAGGTLADRLRHECLPIDEALNLGVVIADALALLHAAGIIHRDIKPSNIGFTAHGVVKLLDFGLAQVPRRQALAAATTTTLAFGTGPASASDTVAAFAGTPAYMSPEALAAEDRPQPSFDLWSLAVVLYEAMTGCRPFEGINRTDLSLAVIRGLQVVPGVLVKGCPQEIDTFFLSALAPQASLRPHSAGAFRDDLRGLRRVVR
jgi:hypothetical protein